MLSLVCYLSLRDTANFIIHLQAATAEMHSGCRQSNLRRQAERCSGYVELTGDGISKCYIQDLDQYQAKAKMTTMVSRSFQNTNFHVVHDV